MQQLAAIQSQPAAVSCRWKQKLGSAIVARQGMWRVAFFASLQDWFGRKFSSKKQ
jgi:hypothetical protein